MGIKSGKWKRLPKTFTKGTIKSIVELSSKGLNQTQIFRTLKMSKNMFADYRECHDAFLEGRDKLSLEVCEAVIKSDDYRDRNILCSRLNLFSRELDIPEITDIPSLLEVQGLMLKEFASGNLPPEIMNTFSKSAALLGQSYFDQDVQAQLDTLKAELKSMK